MAEVLPTHAGAAFDALGRGDAALAERAARAGLARTPGDVAWRVVLALALSAQRRPAEAMPIFEALVAAEPGVPEHWTNLGNCLCELERETDALAPLQRAFQMGDRSAAVFFALARAELAHGRPLPALTCIDRALADVPLDPEFRVFRVRILLAMDEHEAAADAIRFLRSADLPVDLRSKVADLQVNLGFHAEAESSFIAVLENAPGNVPAMIGLASCYERLNRLDDARRIRSRIRDVDDADRIALSQLDARMCDRSGDHGESRRLIEGILDASGVDPVNRCHLQFELGKVCASMGDVPAAVSAFQSAHRSRLAMVSAAHPSLTPERGVLAGHGVPVPNFTPSREPVRDGRRDPVMVVGFPRSGTTLLEQLLDAHPGLASFDEKPFMQQLARRLGDETGLGYPEGLSRADATLRDSLRMTYFQHVDRVRPDLGHRRPVDKNPLSMVLLPLAEMLFPDSRAILALRHPCDVVLSCWMQNFRSPAFAVSFETLASTARSYDRAFSIFSSFESRIGMPIHRLRYEDLTADLHGKARELFEFLDLDWQEDLLDFTERAKRRGFISTPSYSQVVQPVNRRAVGRWQAWRPWFEGEVLDLLRPWIDRFGYAVD